MNNGKKQMILAGVYIMEGVYGIGLDNKIPWKSKEDMKFFKKYTMGKNVFVGSKTYADLPPLPGRNIFVVTSEKDFKVRPGDNFGTFEELLEIYLEHGGVVIGGAKIYQLFEPHVDEIVFNQIGNYGRFAFDTFIKGNQFKKPNVTNFWMEEIVVRVLYEDDFPNDPLQEVKDIILEIKGEKGN